LITLVGKSEIADLTGYYSALFNAKRNQTVLTVSYGIATDFHIFHSESLRAVRDKGMRLQWQIWPIRITGEPWKVRMGYSVLMCAKQSYKNAIYILIYVVF